ncbi:MAG: hypothetical protein PUP46_01570 [Endozoicomonas sp. (ex Botrylloides leachii)]|nr:hypothetical protein [Endozoicomonas sp. (ex Botrylloides leachii)]
MKTYLPIHLFFCLFLSISSIQAGEQARLSSKHIIEHELLLNGLITQLYLLRLNLQDQQARASLDEISIRLDSSFTRLNQMLHDARNKRLFSSMTSQWKTIYLHINALYHNKNKLLPDDIKFIIRYSLQLDKELQRVRKNLLARKVHNEEFRFITAALLIHRLTHAYLQLPFTDNTLLTNTTQQQLHAMSTRFTKRLSNLKQELKNHRHANMPLGKAVMAWNFITESIKSFPNKYVPKTIVVYSEKITQKLLSIQHMFSA